MRKLLIAAVLSVACAGDASAMTGAELQKVCRDINVGPRFGGGDQEWFVSELLHRLPCCGVCCCKVSASGLRAGRGLTKAS